MKEYGEEKNVHCPKCNSTNVNHHITDTSGFCGCRDCGHTWSFDY